MNSYTKLFWAEVRRRIGSLADMAPTIARQVKLALDSENAERLRVRAQEGLEFAESQKVMWSEVLRATEDGFIDLEEGASVLVKLEAAVDEGEDVFTGKDEDDAPDPGQPAG